MVSNTGMVIVAVFPTFSLSYTSLPDSVAAVSTGLVSKICSSSATAGSPSNSTLDVPCEILPMPIAPTLEPLGSHDYTGSPITPVLTVKNFPAAVVLS